jgi:[protein-PII] uridylyltransferase
VIEVNARDRQGLLHDVTSAITDLNLQIVSAHISTYGERAVDVFYVKDVFGLKVDDRSKLRRIERRLRAAIAPRDDESTAEKKKAAAAE